MAQADTHRGTNSFQSILRELGRSTPYPPIQPGLVPNPVEVSFPQEQLWFLSQFGPASVAYNVLLAWRLRGLLDLDALQRSLTEIVRRHEALRTCFPLVDGKPMQRVHPADGLRLEVIDLRGLTDSARQGERDRLMAEEARRPFNLNTGPVFRALLLRCAEQEQILVINVHHIVVDGSSVETLISELERSYAALAQGETPEFPPLPVQYRDYSAWERGCLRSDLLEKYLNNWSQHLHGAAPLDLPTDRKRPSIQSFQGRTQYYRLDQNLTANLVALSRREGATLFMLLCAAFQTLLYRYTGQEDVVVGFPIANRNRVELQQLIGFFINTVPLRVDFSGDPTFRELLKRVRESMLWAYANRDLPFQKVVEKLDPERSTGRNPLFHVMIDQAQSAWLKLDLAGLSAEWLPIDNGTAKFDLSLHCVLGEEEISGWLEYSTDLYDTATIERMLAHFQLLLTGIATDAEMRVSTLPILTEQERRQLLVEWNQTNARYPSDSCIPQMFEAQAERTPDGIAVEAEGHSLTYREVNCRANQLARYLTKLGVGRETLVGVCRRHDWQTAVTLLGILKAGGAYVPLDPAYPRERLAFMAKDTGIRILLTDEQWAGVLPNYEGQVVCLERDWNEIAKENLTNPQVEIMPENLAYVLYTSGSTGRPKGVMGLHRGAVNRFAWMWSKYPFEAGEKTCLKTSLNFVDAVWEVFGPLLAGVPTFVIPEDEVKHPQRLIQTLAQRRVTRFVSVPSLLGAMLDVDTDLGKRLPQLRYWISSGEPLSLELAQRFHRSLPDSVLINLYGSSEVAADVTCYDTRDFQSSDTVLIGRPIANTQIYMLDAHFEPVPVGVAGELCVGGASLARGYWNAPEETDRKFVPNPFGRSGERLYRTGDRTRYRPDGNIEYLGRVDHQVKIRGFRVEPGEIEALLAQHPRVKQTVVVPRENSGGDQRLVAYVVPEAAQEAATEGASEQLQSQRLSHWRDVWSETYEAEGANHDAAFDISGWKSSYTGLPFSADEMHEWVNNTVSRILALHPQRALEIGCGSGLLLARIAPHCSTYCGTDFSSATLGQAQRLITERQDLQHVALLPRGADDFKGFEPVGFDTIILNSVVQYFPSVHYLVRVLEGAVKATRPGGAIFIGDVRDFRLLEAFHLSVELQRSPGSTPLSKLRQQAEKRLAEEPELAVDPILFLALREHLSSIDSVELLVKRGVHGTEMNRFRYDVVLRVAGGSAVSSDRFIRTMDWEGQGLSLASLREVLREKPESLRVTRVPNRRVTNEARALSRMHEDESLETVADLRSALQESPELGAEPEELWTLDSSYAARVFLSEERSDCCDVVLNRTRGVEEEYPSPTPFHETEARQPWTAYANNPLRGAITLKLAPELRQYLHERVPDHMVPSSFVMLEALPLTPNGKIDRRALPRPDDARPELQQAYVEPASALERTIQSVWREVLQIDRVGTHDNFFDLGGHSLRLVVVHSKLVQALNLDLSIVELFQYPTISSLAKHLASEGAEEQSLHEAQERAHKHKDTLRRRAILAARGK